MEVLKVEMPEGKFWEDIVEHDAEEKVRRVSRVTV